MPEDVNPDRSYQAPSPMAGAGDVGQTGAGEQRYPLEEALQAQAALRSAARMPPERFPLPEIIGMFSDEIDALRKLGRPDNEIAAIISGSSTMRVSAEEIQKFYATPEDRKKGPLGAL